VTRVSPLRSIFLAVLALAALCPLTRCLAVVSAEYDPDTGTFSNGYIVNIAVGANDFYGAGYFGSSTIIGNIEGGTIAFEHEVFNRFITFNDYFTYDNSAAGGIDEKDFHATLVGHMLAGTGDGVADGEGAAAGSHYNVTYGIAPSAGLWSAGIATSFSSSNQGSFDTTTASVIAPYKAFFNGVSGTKVDVINSSWGGYSSAANDPEMIAVDGLARQNATVAFVASAGNSGTDSPVAAPGSNYNNISVGSVGGASLLVPSDFTSRVAADFYNPATGITTPGVRSAVDIAAPGEFMFLAAYLGPTGSLGASDDPAIQAIVTGSLATATDRYLVNLAGTSFSAPIVSGGIALLKDRANLDPVLGLTGTAAMDTRVIKSVIMASAQQTAGWNNGQAMNESGVVVTKQSLDYATGAGALNLTAAEVVYLEGTRDVAGMGGGDILSNGWDMANVSTDHTTNDYTFSNPFAGHVELTISLNWFVDREFDNDTDIGSDLSFADLNLQLWLLQDGVFQTLIAESSSVYNNSEFLRLILDAGTYGIRVTLDGYVYDVTGTASNEDYGLAWQAQTVPEPGTVVLLLMGGVVLIVIRRRFLAAR